MNVIQGNLRNNEWQIKQLLDNPIKFYSNDRIKTIIPFVNYQDTTQFLDKICQDRGIETPNTQKTTNVNIYAVTNHGYLIDMQKKDDKGQPFYFPELHTEMKLGSI